MKKLITAVVAVCIAVLGHAAQYQWMATDAASGWFGKGFDSDCAAGTAYLFMVADGIAYDSVVSSVAAGTFIADYSGKAINSAEFNSTLLASTPEGMKGSGTGDFFAVLVADGFSPYSDEGILPKQSIDKVYAYATDLNKGVTIQEKGQTVVNWGSVFDATSVADAWAMQTSDVPEPTSGILLLLGMAGMALRRRKA